MRLLQTTALIFCCHFLAALGNRATAYGLMNLTGVFVGASVTNWLRKTTVAGGLGVACVMVGGVVLLAVVTQIVLLKFKDCSLTSD